MSTQRQPEEDDHQQQHNIPIVAPPVSTGGASAIACASSVTDDDERTGATTQPTRATKKNKEDLKAIIAQLEAEVQRLRTTIDTELVEVQPIFQAGIEALNNVKATYLGDIRSLYQCPPSLHHLLSCIAMVVDDPCVESSRAEPSWNEIRRMLARREFMSALHDFDARTLVQGRRGGGGGGSEPPVYVAGGGPNRLERVERYMSMHPDSFDVDKAHRVSKAGGMLLVWLQGQLAYAKVFWRVEPVRVVFEERATALRECAVELEKMDDDA